MALKNLHNNSRMPWGQKGPRRGPLRAQAAIFDGIMFLLLVSFSVGMMFMFLSDYGIAQSRALRSSHLLNYAQSIGKTLYSIDVSSLKSSNLGAGFPVNCDVLAKFKSNTVADLLKRDISDGKFDNRFGQSDEPNAPGKIALRCALFELMKPIVGSGFDYHAEVLDGDVAPRFSPFPIEQDEVEPFLVTNLPRDDPNYLVALNKGCDSISANLKSKQLLAISTPFRVFDQQGVNHDHQLRICMWPSERPAG